MKNTLRKRALSQWNQLRRERSSKSRKATNIFTLRWPGQNMNDVLSSSNVVLPEQKDVDSLNEIDESLLQIESRKPETKVNEGSESSATNEWMNCWNVDSIEDFLNLPDEELNNDDSTAYEGFDQLKIDAEYLGIYEPCSAMDFSCNDVVNTELLLDVSVTMEDTASKMEQNEGEQREKDDESMESESDRHEEKVANKNRPEKVKKKGGKKIKKNRKNPERKISIAEKKAQLLLMKLLQELSGGEYHVRVSRDRLRDIAKDKEHTDRVTDRGVLDTALKSTVGMVMNEKGDKFMRGYTEDKRKMEYWIEGPNGEGSTAWVMEDYVNIKEENKKLKEENLMIKEENEMLKKEKFEMAQKMQDEEEKFKKMEKANQDLVNQLREYKGFSQTYTSLPVSKAP